jgi:hypothetical protein
MTPDPMEDLAYAAGREAPRCHRCDRFLEDWTAGMPLDCGCDVLVLTAPIVTPTMTWCGGMNGGRLRKRRRRTLNYQQI